MGAQFVAGAVFGVLIFLARWGVSQFIAQDQRRQVVVGNSMGFVIAILAGYGINF